MSVGVAEWDDAVAVASRILLTRVGWGAENVGRPLSADFTSSNGPSKGVGGVATSFSSSQK